MKSHLFILSLGIFALLFPGATQAYYNPETGRWLNRDPLAEKGGINLYGMVSNDAVNRRNYLGQKEDCEVYIECRRLGDDPNSTTAGKAAGYLYAVTGDGVATHCSIVAKWEGSSGERHELTADPSTVDPSDTRWTQYKTEPTGEGHGGFCNACECVNARAQEMAASAPPYSVTGPNSNTYVHDVASECGVAIKTYTRWVSVGMGAPSVPISTNEPAGALGY